MTAGFKTPLVVELGTRLWSLQSDLVWEGSDADLLVVKAGEKTDFASVPRPLQWALPSADPSVVRASVVHDFLCRSLNEYFAARQEIWHGNPDVTWEGTADLVFKPAFSAVDTDAIFRKIMRDEGSGWLVSQFGWIGVRWGALGNPARCVGWLSTAPAVLGLSALFLAAALALLTLAVLAGVWVAS